MDTDLQKLKFSTEMSFDAGGSATSRWRSPAWRPNWRSSRRPGPTSGRSRSPRSRKVRDAKPWLGDARLATIHDPPLVRVTTFALALGILGAFLDPRVSVDVLRAVKRWRSGIPGGIRRLQLLHPVVVAAGQLQAKSCPPALSPRPWRNRRASSRCTPGWNGQKYTVLPGRNKPGFPATR